MKVPPNTLPKKQIPSSLRLLVAIYAFSLSAQASPLIDTNTPGGVMPVSGGTGWILDFSDEFSGATLDATKWGVDVSSSSRAARTDRGIDDWWWKSENVSLDGAGSLKLDVVKHDSNTMYCGSVSSDGKYEPTYGYFEARIKIADTSKDTHTAFWLQSANMAGSPPDDDSAADGAEVDIFESAWTGDYTKAVVHIDGYGAGKNASTKQYSTPSLHTGHHVFGMEWTADYMKIYYDGVLKTTYTGVWVPRVQEWLWLSCGASFGDIGTFLSEPNGLLTSAYVDYVRVWKHPADTTGPVVTSQSPADGTTGVVASSDLVLTFDESIVAGSGLITIKNLTDSTQSTIDITDGSQVSIDFQQLTINPTGDLLPGKTYAVRIAATALDDLVGNSFSGITDDTTWNFTVASSTVPVILVGGTVRNGNFNANPGASVTYSSTAVWHNTKGAQSQVATKDDVTFDGSQNATLTAGRGFGVDTGYTIVEGHAYDISYVWKDDWNWVDGSDQVTVSLFVTSDDTISGTRTNLATHSSGTRSTNDSYEPESQDALYTATATHAGKVLFAAIETTSSGFSRLDNFQLVMTPPTLFETWIDGFSVGGQSALTDNPEGDTMNNLLEFAFGTDPTLWDAVPLVPNGTVNGVPIARPVSGDEFELVFVRRDDHGTSGSLTYTPQFSSDLTTFYDSADTPTFVTDSSDDTNYEVVKVVSPASLPNSQPARFARVLIEEAP
ncbi:MAG: Ig-like domain-containing protein [Verrucomicrobiae bacterium]|nr:Ig-like domain-containing protein [Verrucomicrobiae bacterium]NNJ43160.1 family 16 glycosylhydrolase [Akkermansiaceae bacterium]